jgi:multimeric flavodoxin WrbA
MKIIGFSSGATGKEGNVDRMVKAVMDATGWETQFVKLSNLRFTGCRGCVQLCAPVQMCTADDDLREYYRLLKKADAVVVGSPSYFGQVNATMMAFLERFFGYRHVKNTIGGKPFIAIMSAFRPRDDGEKYLRTFLRRYSGVRALASVYFCSYSPPCFTCGRHCECRIGGLYGDFGEEALTMEITPDMFKQWEDDQDTVSAIQMAADKLKLLKK